MYLSEDESQSLYTWSMQLQVFFKTLYDSTTIYYPNDHVDVFDCIVIVKYIYHLHDFLLLNLTS